MERLRSLLTPPTFPDDEQTRVANLLHWILLSLISLNILDLILLAIFAPETIPTFWLNGVLLIGCVGSGWMMRQGRVYAAGIVFCLLFWVLSAYYLPISGGVTSPAFGFLSIVIIISAVLLGAPGALAFGLLSVATGVILYWAGNNGWLTLQEALPTPSRLFATQTAIFVGLMMFMAISERSVMGALARSRRSEQALLGRNRQLQQEIIERQQAQHEQKRLATILEATSDFVGITDEQSNVLYLNHAGRQLVGLTEGADITKTTIADYHPPHIAQKIQTEVIPAARRDGIWSGEMILQTRDEREIPVSQVFIAHRGADGSIDTFSTIMRDISESKQAEQQRLALALQQERLEAFKEFLSHISHDLRTPMTVINTSLYLLDRLEDPQRRKKKLEDIRQQMTLVERYIQELLDLTHLDHVPELKFAPVDLDHLLSQLQTQFAPVAEGRGLVFDLQLDAPPCTVLADEQELFRALTNLVENAINYTSTGGSVRIQTDMHEGGVGVRVSDTGIGVAADELSTIFDRFYRSEKAREMRPTGTGLGLVIVKRIVEIHGGTIAVESVPGEGTTFRVWLPTVQYSKLEKG